MSRYQNNLEVQITGPSYQTDSKPLSSQQSKNCWSDMIDDSGAKSKYVLHGFPGLKNISTPDVIGKDRGMTIMRDVGYRVVGRTLYSFTQTGIHTAIGTIPGDIRCTFANNAEKLVIVAERIWLYDSFLDTLTEILDPDIVGSTAVTYLNNTFIYNNDDFFGVSLVGEPDNVTGLNRAGADSKPDDIVRAYAFQQTLYIFGTQSCELWFWSGASNPPVIRQDGALLEVGCGARHSIANTDTALFWLGDDRAVYTSSGHNKQVISNSALSYALSTYDRVDDAIAYTLTLNSHNFYVISFPAANKTWALNTSLGPNGWFELSSGTTDGIYQGSSCVTMKNTIFVSDDTNGNLYDLDSDTYTNNLEPIQRRRVTPSIDGKTLGKMGQRIQIKRLELIMETGRGTSNGQGEDPKIQFEVSLDGGRSFQHVSWGSIGRLGQHSLRVEMYTVLSAYDMMFRITQTDPVPFEIYEGAVDLRLAGR